MKLAIVGAGPIGSVLGAYLSKGGNEVAFVDILKDHLAAIKQSGLNISGFAEIKAPISATCESIEDLKSFDPEIIFLCVKASVTTWLIPNLQNLQSAMQTIHSGKYNLHLVCFQNGLDIEDEVAGVFGKDNTLRVVINYAGNYIAPGQIKLSFFNKPNYIGGLSLKGNTLAKEIVQIMTKSGLDTTSVTDIKKYVWEKVILNSALSALCAVTGMTMKQAMDFHPTYHLVESILKEGINVAGAVGYDYGPDFFNHCIEYLRKAGHHKTSMHIDVENGRPTEIDYINKKIVDYGRTQMIDTPYNETITSLIKAIEKRIALSKIST